ncbi:MAG TPA: GNAT family N-acetyltransferase [Acidimicrobiales bacterium]|nr:GNAT family N-acetyltransferase [Acidimicrobiales bacterium]
MEVRPATIDDAEAIRTIYNIEVSGSVHVFDLVPRTLGEQQAWLADHSGVHPAIVAVENGAVAGFGSLSPFRPRPAYATSVEDSIYVAADHRGKGVGKLLLTELLTLAGDYGFHAVFGRIVGHNEVSIAVHRSCGFELVGVEKEVGRKFGQWLDVVEMQRLL